MRAVLLSTLAVCIAGAILFYVSDQRRESIVREMNSATAAAYLAEERLDLNPHAGCSEESSLGGAEWIRRRIDAEVAVKKAESALGGPTDETLLGDQAMLNNMLLVSGKTMRCLQRAYALIGASDSRRR